MAADRLQIVLAAKDEISGQLKQTRAEINRLGREATSLADRMERGEQGLQNEYEETRRELERNRLKHIELGRAASKAKSEIRELTTDATAGAKKMDRSFDGVNRSVGKTHTTSQKFAAGWGKAVGVVAAVTAAIGATAGAFRFLSDSVNEARDARKAMAQTAAVMKSMGRTEAPRAVTKMIDQLEAMSGIDGDNIREMTNVLFTFGNVTGKTFEKANQLALDVSVAFGKDLNSSAVMVGKALNDPAKGLSALTRIGVQFTQKQQDQVKAMMEVGDVAGAQKIILRELSKQVGGSAAAQADAIAKTQVAWGNLKEAIGEVLLSFGAGSGMDLAGMLNKATKWIKRHKGEIVSVLQLIMSAVFKLISVFLKWQSIVLKTFGYLFGAMATTLNVLAKLGLVEQSTADSVRDLADGFGLASEKADKASKWFDGLSEKFHDAGTAGQRLKDKLANIGIEVDRLNQKKVKNLLRDNQIPGVNSQGGTMLAMGGPVTPGLTALVGEIGPELFVPAIGRPRVIGADGPEILDFHTSGTVIPNHLLVPAVAAAAAPAPVAVPSGPGVHIENLTVQDRFDARRELAALMRREARIRSERGA